MLTLTEMQKKSAKPVKIADLKRNLFVRQELDQDRALYFAMMIEAGTEPDPIEGYELNGRTEIPAVVIRVSSQAELISMAYQANTGGPLPPTQRDTEHTVSLLVETGETQKRIAELLGLPLSVARTFVRSIQSKKTRATIQAAVTAVTDGGLTVVTAAEHYGVEPQVLRERLTGHRRRAQQGIAEIQGELTRRYKGVSCRNAALMRRLLDMLADGDVNRKQVEGILDHIESLQNLGSRAIADWRRRFETQTANTPKSGDQQVPATA